MHDPRAMQRFLDRTREVSNLLEVLRSPRFEFVIVYGRRRIGKTTLVSKCVEGNSHLFYTGIDGSAFSNVRGFHERASEVFPGVNDLKVEYRPVFTHLKDLVDVLVLDEYPYMIKKDPELNSILQELVDHVLKRGKLKLVLMGSSVSMMKTLMADPSPLFGRRTFTLKLEPLDFFSFAEFFPSLPIEELVEIYGFTDGIPYYIERVQPPFWDWMERELQLQSFILDELDMLIRMEFREPAMYWDILDAIGSGKRRQNEIASFAGISSTDVSPYLRNLLWTEMITRDYPVNDLARPVDTRHRPLLKNGRYALNDNFLKFWFRFIAPNLTLMHQKTLSVASIQEGYPPYLGEVFESICRQYVKKTCSHDYIGRWWGKADDGTTQEIDILAFNNAGPEAVVGECKWSHDVDARAIARELQGKIPSIKYRKTGVQKKYRMFIFARHFNSRGKITEHDGSPVACIDVGDIEAVLAATVPGRGKLAPPPTSF